MTNRSAVTGGEWMSNTLRIKGEMVTEPMI